MTGTVREGEEFDCVSCGACCRGEDGWVHLGADDDARVEALPEASALVVETRAGGFVRRSLRMVEGTCAALASRPGASAFCSIYAARPAVCRELEAGSDDCLAARRRAGLET